MNYSFTIRKAVVEDATSVYEIMQESFKKYMEATGLTRPVEALEESLDDIINDITNKEVYIAFIDDVAVGTVRVRTMPDKTAYISRFGVKIKNHNIGIGKSLMNLMDKILMSQNIKSVSLHTASENTDLVRFYYGRGYFIDSTTKDRGYVRALMVKNYKY